MKIWIKRLALGWHKLLSGHLMTIAPAYFALLRLCDRLSGGRYRSFLLNSLREVKWPQKLLKARKIVLPSGRRIVLHPHNDEIDFEALLGSLRYEPQVFDYLEQNLAGYGCFLEIGANVGVFTNFVVEKARVESLPLQIVALEPSPEAYFRLRQNLAANHLDAAQSHTTSSYSLQTYQAAATPHTGLVEFFEPDGHLTNGSLVRDFAAHFASQPQSRWVLGIGPEDLLKMLKPDQKLLIKIDIEGFEATLIRAWAALFSRCSLDLVIEVLPEMQQEIYDALAQVCDYEILHTLAGERDQVIRCMPKSV
jgi:FkbM family methyltransferase